MNGNDASIESLFATIVAVCKGRNLETVARMWDDGFGILAVGGNRAGGTKCTVLIGSVSEGRVFSVEHWTLLGVLREAQLCLAECPYPVPAEAHSWLGRIIDKWETDHPADKPN